MKPNFGMITIDWMAKKLLLEIKDERGETKINHSVSFSEIGTK